MSINSILSKATGAGLGLALLGMSSVASAELVSYDFVADINWADSVEPATVGLDGLSQLTGSFSYDSDVFSWGFFEQNSNSMVDSSLDLTIDQLSDPSAVSTTLNVDYWGENELTIVDTDSQSGHLVRAELQLDGVNFEGFHDLPASLSLSDGDGSLKLFISTHDDAYPDIVASISSLIRTSGVSTPELDPASGSAALVLLLGGAALMAGRRRRELEAL